MTEKVLLRHLDVPDIRKLEVYLAHGGYEAARKAHDTLAKLYPKDARALEPAFFSVW